MKTASTIINLSALLACLRRELRPSFLHAIDEPRVLAQRFEIRVVFESEHPTLRRLCPGAGN